jgi:hypothetical protein
VSVKLNRAQLVKSSSSTPNPPYGVNPKLTFYCPQENLEALDIPVVKRFLRWAEDDYKPASTKKPKVLLLLPCQKIKPYAISPEHLAINSYLLAAGYAPTERGDWPEEIGQLAAGPLLSNGPLEGHGLRIDRAVISEPFGFVPYSAMYYWNGKLSPCGQYDDPGLFAHRGLACTWRSDNSAVAQDGKWRWGDNERAAYVEVHNRLAESMATALSRIASNYEAIYAYVAPALTHRSFIVDRAQSTAAGMSNARRVGSQMRPLIGVNDLVPGLVNLVPDATQLGRLRKQMGGRLPAKLLSTDPALRLLTTAIGANR